jgi:hypothetical protein
MREVKIPDEILFITHSNKGSGVFYPIPAIRLEFEPGKVVEAAGDMLWKSMTSGKQLEGNVTVAPKLIAAEKKSPIYVYS